MGGHYKSNRYSVDLQRGVSRQERTPTPPQGMETPYEIYSTLDHRQANHRHSQSNTARSGSLDELQERLHEG